MRSATSSISGSQIGQVRRRHRSRRGLQSASRQARRRIRAGDSVRRFLQGRCDPRPRRFRGVRSDKYAAAIVRGEDYKALRDKLAAESELVILFDDSYKGDAIRDLVDFGESDRTSTPPPSFAARTTKRFATSSPPNPSW